MVPAGIRCKFTVSRQWSLVHVPRDLEALKQLCQLLQVGSQLIKELIAAVDNKQRDIGIITLNNTNVKLLVQVQGCAYILTAAHSFPGAACLF